MLPSQLIEALRVRVAEVQEIADAVAYEPRWDIKKPTAWVDLESLPKAASTIADEYFGAAQFRITVGVPQGTDTKISAWDLGWAVAQHVDRWSWGDMKLTPSTVGDVTRATLDQLEGDLDGVEIQLVQRLSLPALNPAFAGSWLSNPSEAWISRDPDIGIPNIPLYRKVSEWP